MKYWHNGTAHNTTASTQEKTKFLKSIIALYLQILAELAATEGIDFSNLGPDIRKLGRP